MASLLASDSEDDDASGPSGFNVNESYARSYDRFREKEVFQRLKDKYGEGVARRRTENEYDEESSSTSEDEDGREWTEQVDKDFFRTLSCLKGKDPSIYDQNTHFFKNVAVQKAKKMKKEEPMYLADLERKVMVEKEGKFEEVEDETLAKKSRKKSYAEEQEELRRSFKVKLEEDDDEDDGGFLREKVKTEKQIREEEEDCKKWLAGKREKLQDEKTESELKGLRDFWTSKQLDKDEKFLRDYILSKKYEATSDDDDDEKAGGRLHDSDEGLSEDERTLDQMETFEHKFNFRFEEPDQDFIKRYPRTTMDSLRQKDNRRAQKREEARKRKDEEKRKRMEELKQLKAMKRKEIEAKLARLAKVAGTDKLGFVEGDVDEDFNPEEHDRRMAEVFDQYDQVEVEGEEGDARPEFSDLGSDVEEALEVENWDEWDGPQQEQHEAEERNDDQEYEDEEDDDKETAQQAIIESTWSKKKKRKSKFTQAMEKRKPVFDPKNHPSYEKYLEEYYKLDHEDVIGGNLPCRFKYRNVVAADFGLSTEEVLSAPDRELNSWCSLRKTCQYRTEDEEKSDVRSFTQKGKNMGLKKKLLPSLFAANPEEELLVEKERRAAKSKKRKKEEEEEEKKEEPPAKKKTKKKKKTKATAVVSGGGERSSTATSTNAMQQKLKVDPEAGADLTVKRRKATGRDTEARLGEEAFTEKMKKGAPSQKKVRQERRRKPAKEDPNAEVRMSDARMEAFLQKPNQLKRKIKKRKFHDP